MGGVLLKKYKIKRQWPFYGVVVFIFGVVFTAGGAFFALNRIVSKWQHEKKWRDYDDCGLF